MSKETKIGTQTLDSSSEATELRLRPEPEIKIPRIKLPLMNLFWDQSTKWLSLQLIRYSEE